LVQAQFARSSNLIRSNAMYGFAKYLGFGRSQTMMTVEQLQKMQDEHLIAEAFKKEIVTTKGYPSLSRPSVNAACCPGKREAWSTSQKKEKPLTNQGVKAMSRRQRDNH